MTTAVRLRHDCRRRHMADLDSDWQSKGATLSDKTARKEFGLTQEEIIAAIRAGKLHYREMSIYGNPWLRLLRKEVEALVRRRYGAGGLKDRQVKAELARVDRELRGLKIKMAKLQKQRAELIGGGRRS